ncbi:hypothetical protein GF348_03420 [candidate division KSB3 bacterium]|nr:hypothetical protein [candidate division KSB3 bacterium]
MANHKKPQALEHVRQDDIIDETIAFWEKKTGYRMNREEAREAMNNMNGFFQVLSEWDTES